MAILLFLCFTILYSAVGFLGMPMLHEHRMGHREIQAVYFLILKIIFREALNFKQSESTKISYIHLHF